MSTEVGTVNYTLWRNAELLGRVRIPLPTSDGIFGMLEVEQSFRDIEPLMQICDPFSESGRVFISFLRDAHRGPGPVALRELSPEEARGAAPERVFSVRDENGEHLEIDFLTIDRYADPIPEQGELVELCRKRGIRVSPWILGARLRAANAP
jgi:hypothetical protein